MSAAAPTLAAEAVVFAINAAIKLSQSVKEAYIDQLQAKELVLPLPEFDGDISFTTVRQYFRNNEQLLEPIPELQLLHQEAEDAWDLGGDKLERYKQYYRFFKQSELGTLPNYKQEAIRSLFHIRQWEQGYLERQTPLQQLLGTLVEVGIDYFAQVPGALNTHSAYGRLLLQFLSAFDEVEFSRPEQPLNLQFNQIVLPRLFAAAAETVVEYSPEMAEDEQVQRFVRVTARRLAEDLYQRAEGLSYQQEQELIDWGQILLRSLVRHAGDFALSHTRELFGTNEQLARVMAQSGDIWLDQLLSGELGALNFRAALSPQTLDEIIRLNLDIIARHPNLLSRKEGLQNVIQGVAEAMEGRPAYLGAGLGPELLVHILQETSSHLPVIWPVEEEDAEHLLLVALRIILDQLSDAEAEGGWHLAFSRADLIELIELLLDEVVQQPLWLEEAVSDQPLLADVLEAVFQNLQLIPPEERLRPEILRWIIRASLRAAIDSPHLLERIPWGTQGRRKLILSHALELLFAFLFRSDTPPGLNRIKLLEALLAYIMEEILTQYPDERALALIELVLFRSGIDYSQGFDRALADEMLDAALAAFANYPELASEQEALQRLIQDLARSIEAAQLREPGLLPRLTRLLLEKTGENAHLLLDLRSGQPEHLLATAAREVLSALSAQNDAGAWRPALSAQQGLQLLELLLDESLRHPHWISDTLPERSLLQEVTDTALSSLEAQPFGRRISAEALEALVTSSLYTAAAHPKLLERIPFADDATERSILERALQLMFSFLFPTETTAGQHRLHLFSELLAYVLEGLLQRQPDEKGLIVLKLVLSENSGIDYSKGFDRDAIEALADSILFVIAQNPELISRHRILQLMFADLAIALRDSGLGRPDLLTELIRLTLDNTADHLDLLVDMEEEDPASLLVTASEQVLRAIAKPPREGRWKPRLSNEQVRSILDILQWEVINHPQWAQQGLAILFLLEALFAALQAVPYRQRLPFRVLVLLLRSVLRAARQQHQLLVQVKDEEEQAFHIRLRFSLEEAFILIYQEEANEELLWRLSQGEIIASLIDYYLLMIVESPGRPEDFERAQQRLRQALQTWKADFTKTLEEVLAVLE